MAHAGKYRYYITVQYNANPDASDSYGQPSDPWQAFGYAWASKEPLRGREFLAAEQLQTEVSYRFRLREMSGVTSKMRIQLDGLTYSIEAVLPPNKPGGEMQLLCSEGVASA